MNQQLINNVFQWGAEKNLHQPDLRPQFIKLTEELGELAAAIARDNQSEIMDAVGDMLVVLIQLGGSYAVALDDEEDRYRFGPAFLEICLDYAWREISLRTGKTVNGTFIKDEKAEARI
jgi:NTP pyrophosphatase (non-canonical NTP hydrolase)